MRFSDLEKASVGILGIGREGQAVWRQIRHRYPEKPLTLFAESKADEGFFKGINPAIDTCHFGAFDVEKLKQFDVLVRSAGISPYRDELQRLQAMGVQFTTASNLWFAENPAAKTICITGTKGKSTTAALTAHLLKQAGIKTTLAGNIGRPMLDCENGDTDWWVIELSSYQLADLEAKPDISLLLNLSEEHVDWHGGAQQYETDKLRLADLAKDGHLVLNGADPKLVNKVGHYPGVKWFNRDGAWRVGEGGVVGVTGELVAAPSGLPGQHNMQNLAAALTAIDLAGAQIPCLDDALSSFMGLPHRLQFIGKRAGVRFVDDSISTTPVSVTAALQTLGHQNTVVLLGGMDRGLDWAGFARQLVDQTPYAIITLPDNGPKIMDTLEKAGIAPAGGLHHAARLSDAVALARKLAPKNGCILLSPGAPSFPHFRDFEDRGNQFKKLAGIEKSH